MDAFTHASYIYKVHTYYSYVISCSAYTGTARYTQIHTHIVPMYVIMCDGYRTQIPQHTLHQRRVARIFANKLLTKAHSDFSCASIQLFDVFADISYLCLSEIFRE